MSEFLLMPMIMHDHRCMTTLKLLIYKTYVDVYTLDLLLYMLMYFLALLFISIYCI